MIFKNRFYGLSFSKRPKKIWPFFFELLLKNTKLHYLGVSLLWGNTVIYIRKNSHETSKELMKLTTIGSYGDIWWMAGTNWWTSKPIPSADVISKTSTVISVTRIWMARSVYIKKLLLFEIVFEIEKSDVKK